MAIQEKHPQINLEDGQYLGNLLRRHNEFYSELKRKLSEDGIVMVMDVNQRAYFFVDLKQRNESSGKYHETVYANPDLSYKLKNGRTIRLTNCSGIKIADSKNADPTVVVNWVNSIERQTRDEKAGHFYTISEDAFLHIQPATVRNLQLGQVNLSVDEICQIHQIPHKWPDVKAAISLKTKIKNHLSNGTLPLILNTTEFLSEYVKDLYTRSADEKDLQYFDKTFIRVEELRAFVTEKVNLILNELDFSVNFIQIGFSEFSKIYSFILALYCNELDQFFKNVLHAGEIDSFYTLRGIDLHEIDTLFDSYTQVTETDLNEVFPTDKNDEKKLLLQHMLERVSPPLNRDEEHLYKVFRRIIAKYADDSRLKLGEESIWEQHEKSMKNAAKKLAKMRAQEFSTDRRPQQLIREMMFTTNLFGSYDDEQPIGTQITAVLDKLAIFIDEGHYWYRMEDLKIRRKRQKELSPIDYEVQRREKQLLRLLTVLFIQSDFATDGTVSMPDKKGYILNSKIKNDEKAVRTSLKTMDPISGEQDDEFFSFDSMYEIEEFNALLTDVCIPMAYILRHFDWDFELVASLLANYTSESRRK